MKRSLTLMKAMLFALLFSSLSLFAADPAQYGTPFAGVPDPRDVNMYQVHIRPYSAAGNFAGVTARLDAIKALGVNVIYLMPFYPYGTDSRSSMSPYCIKDFTAVGSEYGTLTDLRNLVDGAHNRGMAVIIDWVANQTSWDHPWITQHPDWYVQSGGVIQPLNPFPDVAALNFNNSAMRTEMINCMRYWVFAANIDGFRCDYANNAPLDFWTQAITNLRGITTHKLLMFAEGDRLENFQAGFDLNFGDKWYYDAIKPIANGTSVAQIQTTTNTEYTYATGSQQVVRYTANHDTETNETAIGVFKSHAGVCANFVVSACMRGVPFLTSGQEVDFNQTIPWPYTSVDINWNTNPSAATDFANILKARTNSTAIRRGTMTNYSNTNVCAFTKISGTEKAVVIVNLRNASSTYVIPSAVAGTYTNMITNGSQTLTSGATITLSAFQYYILSNASVTPIAVTGVSASPTSVSIPKGLTSQLTATISPSNATNQNVTWSSNNTSVATVSSSGLVTAVNTGSATITCTTQDGNKTATCAVTVTAATGFTVYFYRPSNWGTNINIYYWNTLPAGVIPTVNWPGVAMTNNNNGWYSYTFTNVTSTNLIFNDGTNQTADLTRSTNGWYQNNTWYNSAPGNVAVTSVTMSPTSASIVLGGTQQLTATVNPSNATNKTISWASNNTGVASVSSNGLVTAVAVGTATITVTTQDGNKTATCAITVTAPATTYYTIRNRWKGTYLYDAGANVQYGTTASNNNYLWVKETIDATYFWLRNAGTGEYMHIENQTGAVQCTSVDKNWWSSQWSADYIDGTWNRIRNRWQTGSIIHVENQNGNAQYSGAQDGWYSAQWQFTATALKSAGDEQIIVEEPFEVTTYPNPVTGNTIYIDIKGDDSENYSLIIYALDGSRVLSETIQLSDEVRLDIPEGMYVLKVQSDSVNYTKKIIVQ